MSDLLSKRRAGVLLHPTSLPSGRLDADVERWLDFMQSAGLSVWQMLPLVIPDHTGSPYQSCSAFAAWPGLLSLAASCDEGVDAHAMAEFREREADWLTDYARFEVLKELHGDVSWHDWPLPLRDRHAAALLKLDEEHAEAIARIVEQQFLLQCRWRSIRRQAAARNILLFGDMPIFVALDSADVWAHRDQFLLDSDGQPTFVAGVPPDYFSETGQRWGNPHYRWSAMQSDGFRWWKSRLRRQFDWFDIVRLDHFRGLEASWMIPAECPTAIDGHWEKTPGEALLKSLLKAFPDLPIVAEDLGVITAEVVALRKQFELPGMAVLQFAFDAFDDNPHKPKNITPDTVAYTGTHDNNTVRGWFAELDPESRGFVYQILQADPSQDILDLMLNRTLETQANLAVLPMQDILGLDGTARMNIPGQANDNWRWRFDWSVITADSVLHLRKLIENAGRLHDR